MVLSKTNPVNPRTTERPVDLLDDLPPPPPYTLYDPDLVSLGGDTLSPGNEPFSIASVPSSKRSQRAADEEVPKKNHADVAFVSGAPYFAMRPPPGRPKGNVTFRIPLLRNAKIEKLPIPGVKSVWKARDVNQHDWETFLTHLVLDPRGESSQEFVSVDQGRIASEHEAKRRCRLNGVTEEWNGGFFLPRGVKILLEIEPFPVHTSFADEQRINGSPEDPKREASVDESLGLALYNAVAKGDRSLVQTLLESNAQANERPPGAAPALYKAVFKGNRHIAEMLLEQGRPDLEASSPGGESVLYCAVSKGDEQMVRRLLRHGAKASTKPPGGKPALYNAVSQGHREIVHMLLESSDIDVDAIPPGGSSSMYKAANKGNFRMMELLLKRGANPAAKPSGGGTAMHLAARKGDLQMTRTLLEFGSNPDAAPSGSHTSLYHCIDSGNQAITEMLLLYGADVNYKPSGANTSLWIAAKKSDSATTQLLIDHGAKLDLVPWGGDSALWHAADRSDFRMAKLLLQRGANPDERITGGNTALWNAASKGDQATARLLLKCGADPHKKAYGAETPLSRAVNKGHSDIVRMMLDSEGASSRETQSGIGKLVFG